MTKDLGDRPVYNLRDYHRISEAAEHLGVSPNTFRNWEQTGKIVAHRHPINKYRLFKPEELDALLKQVSEHKRNKERLMGKTVSSIQSITPSEFWVQLNCVAGTVSMQMFVWKHVLPLLRERVVQS